MAGERVKEKIAKVFTAEEAADYLRQMADALEQGKIKFDETELETEGAVQVKGALKSRPHKTSLKLKLKFVSVEEPEVVGEVIDSDEKPIESDEEKEEPSNGKLSYKKLKKNMGGKYKSIRNHLKNEAMPPLEEIESFYGDCESMVSYPDKGDEYYERFMAAAARMAETARDQDLPGLKSVIEELDQLKKDCHSRYK